MKVQTDSPEETLALGRELGEKLPPDTIVCLFGDLGAGKTTLIKGIVEGATTIEAKFVTSPTFVFMQEYEGNKPVFHFDLYRLESSKEFIRMGFDEVFGAGGIVCIEWSERIADLIKDPVVSIRLEHKEENARTIIIDGL